MTRYQLALTIISDIIQILIEDYELSEENAKEIFYNSWLNNTIQEYPELFLHDSPTKWADEIMKNQ